MGMTTGAMGSPAFLTDASNTTAAPAPRQADSALPSGANLSGAMAGARARAMQNMQLVNFGRGGYNSPVDAGRDDNSDPVDFGRGGYN